MTTDPTYPNWYYSGGAGRPELFSRISSAPFIVDAGDADDLISGYDGYDLLYGGLGNDVIEGRRGSDTIYGDNYADPLAPGGFDEILGGVGPDVIFAGGGNDFANGEGGNDQINGGSGSDRLWGGGGADVVAGGDGNDLIFGNTEARSPALRGGAAFYDGATDQLFPNAIKWAGFAGQLAANDPASDRLDGGAGNDRLEGGLGTDILTGGTGLDKFVFNFKPSAQNRDQVTDFLPRDDAFLLDNAAFTKLAGSGTLAEARFHRGPAAHDANDRIIYNPASGALIYDLNGSGAGQAVVFALIDKNLLVTHADFLQI